MTATQTAVQHLGHTITEPGRYVIDHDPVGGDARMVDLAHVKDTYESGLMVTATGRTAACNVKYYGGVGSGFPYRGATWLTPTITPRQILGGGLPSGATGVHWPDTDWTECAEHIHDESWLPDNLDAVGTILYGVVDCDACSEREEEERTQRRIEQHEEWLMTEGADHLFPGAQ